MKEEALREVSSIKDFEIILDKKVTFTEHIQQIIGRSKRSLNFVFRNYANFLNLDTLMALYTALVRPVMEFGVLVWNPSCQKAAVEKERIQKRFLRYFYYEMFQYYPNNSISNININVGKHFKNVI